MHLGCEHISTAQCPFPLARLGDVTRRVCPRCGREFGSANQAHTCVPGITVDELLARHPAWVAEIYTAIIDRLRQLGRSMRTRLTSGFPQERSQIAEVRPRVRSVQLLLYLPERVGQWLELSYDFDNLSVSPAECPPPSA